MNIFINLEKHSVQLTLESVPGKSRPFLVKYVRVRGSIVSPQTLLNALTST